MPNSISCNQTPIAIAEIHGSSAYPNIRGTAIFKKKNDGLILTVEVLGLPTSTEKCNNNIFALHIHSGNSCTGNATDPFANAGVHYNPYNCKHPQHAGDLPPLFENNGYAYLSVYTTRLSFDDILNKFIIIHDNPDDFTTQPSGNSGTKIACGKIVPFK